MTPGLESGALELTPGIGAAAEFAKTTLEETDMARSRGGRRAAPRDLLADITAEEPAVTTPAKSQEATRPEALPDIVAELQRIGTQLEALAERSAELSGAVERSAKAAAGAEEAIGELRSGVDTAVWGTKEARDALSKRLRKIEAAVGELLAVPRAAGTIVEHLKLARSNLVGLSQRMEGLERRLPEKLESIERAAAAVRETKKLEALTERNAQILPAIAEMQGNVKECKRHSLYSVIGFYFAVCFMIALDVVRRSGLL